MKARDRMIRIGFYQNEVVGRLDPMAQLLIPALWQLADREGRLETRPERIGAHAFPYRVGVDVAELLSQLSSTSPPIISFYGGGHFFQIHNFTKHQTIHNNEKQSELPEPVEFDAVCIDKSSNADTRLPTSLFPVSIGISNSISNSKDKSKKHAEDPPIKIIIGHLNKTIKKQFKLDSIDTIQKINRLWGLGWRLADFEHVHIVKAQDWDGKKHAIYLRPKTLYSPENFESYRNQTMKPQMSDRLRNNMKGAAAYLRRQGIELGDLENGTHTDVRQDECALPDQTGRGRSDS